MIREFIIAVILEDNRGIESLVIVFTGYIDVISRVYYSAESLVSPVDIVLVIDLISIGLYNTKSLELLGIGLLIV